MRGRIPWNKGRRLISKPRLDLDMVKVKAAYDTGLSLRELAAKFGCSWNTIWGHMERAGIERRDCRFRDGQRPWITGRRLSAETRQRLSISHIGQGAWNKGRHFSEYVSEEKREARRRKISETSKQRWANLEYATRVRQKIISVLCKRPNKWEQKIVDIVQQFALPYKYVGDGSVIIGGLNPDFINVNGAKVVIEVFGDIYHNRELGFRSIPEAGTESGRRHRFAEYGFKIVVLWVSELQKMTPEEIAKRILASEGGDVRR